MISPSEELSCEPVFGTPYIRHQTVIPSLFPMQRSQILVYGGQNVYYKDIYSHKGSEQHHDQC